MNVFLIIISMVLISMGMVAFVFAIKRKKDWPIIIIGIIEIVSIVSFFMIVHPHFLCKLIGLFVMIGICAFIPGIGSNSYRKIT